MRPWLVAATTVLAMVAFPAGAVVLYDLPGATGALASPGAVAVNFAAGAGAGRADFRIRGYASLDGADNGYTDVFTLSHNGADIYSGSFNLGGGGNNVQLFGPQGSWFAASTPGMWRGGFADLSVPLVLASGANILGFRYAGNAQGLGDEGWGLDSLRVSGGSPGGVPEPASWAMLIIGFGLVGAMLRSRRLATRQVSS